jgi:predicted RecA/RadA family phage recombinase
LQNDTSAVAGVVGVFVGCSYTDPTLGYKLFSQNYPANTVADDIEAIVVDDPDAIFKVVNCTGSTADGATTGLLPLAKTRATTISCNAELVLNTGLTTTGNSRMGVFINNVTSVLPFTVIDVVEDTKNSSGNFTEFLVKFTAGYHRYDHTVGV